MTATEFKKTLGQLRLSQAEAARRLKVSANAVWMWANGRRRIPGPVEAALECWGLTESTSGDEWGFVKDRRRYHVILNEIEDGRRLWFVRRTGGDDEVTVPFLGGHGYDTEDIEHRALEAFAVLDNTREG